MAFFRDDQHVHDSRWKIMIIIVIAVLMMFGVFLIKGGYEKRHAPPTITQEEYVEELILLQEQIINHKQELIDLYELKRLQEEGKLHSS